MSEQMAKQLQLKHTIERALENYKKVGRSNFTPAKIRARISTLQATWLRFEDGHAALTTSTPETARANIEYFRGEFFDVAEEAYQRAIDFMSDCLEELEPVSAINASNASPKSTFSLAHLPPIRLPPFEGRYDDWENFRDRFNALIIQNDDLDDFARMHFLTSCLKGRAYECVASIPVTADNFEVAWTTLTVRYENKRRLLQQHLNSLLNLTALSRESASDLHDMIDRINVAISGLKSLDRTPDELWNDVLVHVISHKLDSVTRKAWNHRTSDRDDPPLFTDLAQFMIGRARALEDYANASPGTDKAKASSPRNAHVATAATSTISACSLCQARHYLSACPQFTSRTPAQRRDITEQQGRCFNCLSCRHSVNDCPSKYSCRVCHKRHHSLLHVGPDVQAITPSAKPSASRFTQASEMPKSVQSLHTSTLPSAYRQVLLATAQVTVGVSSGRSVVVRALLDQGSQMTFISEGLAQLLRAKKQRMPISISAVGGVPAGTARFTAIISVSPRDSHSPSYSAEAAILRDLTLYAPSYDTELASYSHLSDLSWADPHPTSSEPIQIIIGADLYHDVTLDGRRKGKRGEPTAQESIFGWVISGPLGSVSSSTLAASRDHSENLHALSISVHHCLTLPSLEDEIKKFWEVEELPQRSPFSAEDEQCEEHFKSTFARRSDGRYIVRLPFKTGPPIDIGESRFTAARQLEALTRRLHARPELLAAYTEFLADYERRGHMRAVPDSVDSTVQCVYIPHHPVLRESSSTTKLRVVFNASSATTNKTSLNDHTLIGPKLQTDLSAVILRWRQFKFVCTADIAKMYRQIRVDAKDVNYQRILWKGNPDNDQNSYQLLTVTYGMACAPFLALRVLQQLAHDEGASFPLAVPILSNNIYVDDVLFGDNDRSSLLRTRNELIALLRKGGFELKKWASNSTTLLSDIDDDEHGLACSKSLSVDESVKILGIAWTPSLDQFEYRVSLDEKVPNTKRFILSAIARLYDPLGWVTPITIAAKIFMQSLWREKLTWDDPIPPILLARWTAVYSGFSCLNGLRLPRWTGLHDNDQHIELHGFADASNRAYSAVVYLRVVSNSGSVVRSLLAGKSKVAPLHPLSIPRLELSAAVLLTRLMSFVRDTIGAGKHPCTCWTDSTIVLAWLRQHPSRWKTFVANRVAEVQTRLPKADWRHVATTDNPADCASRGLLGSEFADHALWWQGPSWLGQSPDQWPQAAPILPAETSLEERKVAAHAAGRIDTFEIASRFSSWPRVIRVTAYAFKFISLCRRGKFTPQRAATRSLTLTAAECTAAKIFWIRRLQAELFPETINTLSKGRNLPEKDSNLRLRPFLDRDGVLRVGGRLGNAPMPVTARHPVLLASHPLVVLIVDQAHKRALHAGLQLTLSTLRRDFWVLRARTIAKSLIHRCIVCVRERAEVPSQLMADLPAIRVAAPKRAFLHCGVDYAGPLHTRASSGRGIKTRKAYIALFICLATRAIHLELVSDYSTAAFLNAFSRFCSRRGLPQSIYSDNGTTFIGADRELTRAYHAALRNHSFQNSTASDNVTWHFIPPSAPHFGGIWEAGVRSVKHHLRRVIGGHTLTFEELTTLLYRIEACLNSRPIAPLKDDIEDYDPLTPGHFLIGSAITASPEPSLLDVAENRLTRWQLLRQMTEQFWRLWANSYVNTLQQRSKWRKEQPPVKIGQLVLLRNSLLPPCKWELGRIVACHPGPDGLTRVVTIKTAAAELKRPIVKLCLLPVECENRNA